MARSLQGLLILQKGIIILNHSRVGTSRLLSQKRWLSLTSSNSTSFIPLSSKTLFKNLLNEKEYYDEESLRIFEKFAVRVDSAITNQNISLLPGLKLLYDPLNPDVSTRASQTLTRQELQDREFWFLQKFSAQLLKSGFQEVDGSYLKKSFDDRPVGQGVVASLQPESFDVLRCWTLSDVKVDHQSTWGPIVKNLGFMVEDGPSKKIFKRVVIACRPKGKDKLSLKLFKDIPTNQLHLLLPPVGGLKMHETYCKLLYFTSGLSGLFLMSRYAVVWLIGTNHHLGYVPLGFSTFFGLTAVLLWTNFKQRQKRYLCDILEVLSNRFVVANQNLLSVVSDKVQEEMLKSVLITYFFLMPSKKELLNLQDGRKTKIIDLENIINTWMELQTGQKINFDAHLSLAWLSKMGLIQIDSNTDEVLPLPLPQALKVLLSSGKDFLLPVKVEEFDLFYDDLAEATNLEKQDLLDKVSSTVWKQLNRFRSRF